ncbi:N-acetyltransferase [Rathayibacter rathayi]|uniref:N-acetyltransferase n=1 Tax=Rathayibacter rathayi TaxID=33887 RepID=A0ABD6W823_RATRA|nr:GNAT family protein [Rathayibacter rathayi]AZZ49941.1 N-acetyltransferase [Rathayibacter rathayi]MWV75225.1 GNAT family N-acetyltransferase [Rathayibacter rathayi NCPPB 2980 = VKM Ac-1601]PPF13945.1 N-acetyltransferase [Rathayibacter rathayi]PPF23488.1 N-acetyltransferase [Rathayibacter rathayi]PPF48645.1 N-acetyltransferase [Rathayibacter rathayi]
MPSPRRPGPVALVGRSITLEPMTAAHLDPLRRAIARPEVFAGGYGGGPAGLPGTPEEFRGFAGRYYPWGTGLTFAVLQEGRVVGTTSLADFDERREAAHLGWTAYAPEVWSTAVNPEAKRLVLGLAFDSGYERVKLQADAANARSRAAILRLGAVFEGVLRHDQRRADGSWRDTAVHSILAAEWPAVRDALERRIDAALALTPAPAQPLTGEGPQE